VLGYIRGKAFSRPATGRELRFRGGADSVALLRLLLELRQEIGVVLSVVHFNHTLRGTDRMPTRFSSRNWHSATTWSCIASEQMWQNTPRSGT